MEKCESDLQKELKKENLNFDERKKIATGIRAGFKYLEKFGIPNSKTQRIRSANSRNQPTSLRKYLINCVNFMMIRYAPVNMKATATRFKKID
jgi:hypothetical protein